MVSVAVEVSRINATRPVSKGRNNGLSAKSTVAIILVPGNFVISVAVTETSAFPGLTAGTVTTNLVAEASTTSAEKPPMETAFDVGFESNPLP